MCRYKTVKCEAKAFDLMNESQCVNATLFYLLCNLCKLPFLSLQRREKITFTFM